MTGHLTKQEKKLFALCAATAVIYIFYNGLILLLKEKEAVLDQRILAQKNQLEQDLSVIRKAEVLNERHNMYLLKLRRTESEGEIVSSMLSEIDTIADTMGLHVMELKPKTVRHREYNNQFLISLIIKSELEQITRFLYILQQRPYLFDVEEVKFTAHDTKVRTFLTTKLVLKKTFIPSTPKDANES